MEKSNFDNLLEQYVNGQTSPEETRKIEVWLDVMKAEKGNDMELSPEDEEKLFKKITANMDNIDEIVHFRPENYKPRPFFLKGWFQIAATILLLVTSSLTILYFNYRGDSLIQYFAKSERDKLILNDGTIVWLTKNSKLNYFEKANEGIRQAELTGEALFEVAKDPDRPFTIECGNIKVKVIGTSFNVKTNTDHLELQVLTGKVNLSSIKDEKGVDVSSLEKVTYTTDGKIIERSSLKDSEIEEVIESTDYNMRFSNTEMKEVFQRIEKKFNARVSVENQHVNKCRLTADFTDKSLEQTMSMISQLLDIKYTIDKPEVKVSGKGCN